MEAVCSHIDKLKSIKANISGKKKIFVLCTNPHCEKDRETNQNLLA